MQVNTMYVYYGKDNLPYKDKERQVHFPIAGNAFEGASNTTKIRFYIEQIGEVDANWIAIAKLPNGKIGSQILSTYYDYGVEEWYAEMSLSQFYTQYKGDVYISLNGYTKGSITYNDETGLYESENDPIVQATGSIKLAINYAPQYVNSGVEDEITFEDIYGALGDKINKNSPNYIKVVDSIDNINTSAYENYLTGADIVYDKAHDKYYSLSGEYPTLVATIIEHIVNIPSDATFPYQLSESEVNDLKAVDGVILFKNKVYSYLYGTATGVQKQFYNITIDNYNGFNELHIVVEGFNLIFSTNKVAKTAGVNNYVYSKGKIDSLLSAIKTNSFKKVDLTTYPTLESFLASSGEEGIIYLYPVDTSESPTFESGFYEYIWEDNGWLSIGSTEIDIGNFYTKEEVNSLLSGKEDIANKTTELSSSSTNTQYPSAKAVYDMGQDIREIAEGKTKTVVISYAQQLIDIADYGTAPQYFYKKANGETLETYQDFLDYVFCDQISVLEDFINSTFNSNNDYIWVGQEFVISTENVVYRFGQYPIGMLDLNVGDIILVIETDVPDRWLSTGDVCHKLETTKVDLTNYYAKNNDLIPTTDNSYDVGGSANRYKNGYFSNSLYLYTSANNYARIYKQPYAELDIYINSYLPVSITETTVYTSNLFPKQNNTYDLGNASYKWKDLYLSGNAYVSNIYGDSALKIFISGTELYNFGYGSLFPKINNSKDLGTSSNKWKDIWVNNLKGVSTMTQAQYDALATKDSDTFYFIEEE